MIRFPGLGLGSDLIKISTKKKLTQQIKIAADINNSVAGLRIFSFAELHNAIRSGQKLRRSGPWRFCLIVQRDIVQIVLVRLGECVRPIVMRSRQQKHSTHNVRRRDALCPPV